MQGASQSRSHVGRRKPKPEPCCAKCGSKRECTPDPAHGNNLYCPDCWDTRPEVNAKRFRIAIGASGKQRTSTTAMHGSRNKRLLPLAGSGSTRALHDALPEVFAELPKTRAAVLAAKQAKEEARIEKQERGRKQMRDQQERRRIDEQLEREMQRHRGKEPMSAAENESRKAEWLQEKRAEREAKQEKHRQWEQQQEEERQQMLEEHKENWEEQREQRVELERQNEERREFESDQHRQRWATEREDRQQRLVEEERARKKKAREVRGQWEEKKTTQKEQVRNKQQYALDLDNTRPVHTLCIHCVHTLCIHCAYTVCIHCAYTVHTLCIHCAYTVHTLCIHSPIRSLTRFLCIPHSLLLCRRSKRPPRAVRRAGGACRSCRWRRQCGMWLTGGVNPPPGCSGRKSGTGVIGGRRPTR
jgi:hypothetical protein